jgi:hemerythrin superfamily protein
MAKVTTDHGEIRRWVEARGGCPAHVKQTSGKNDVGVLRVDFPGYSGEETLECITWEQWFEKFDREGLAFIYQDRTRNGQVSRFNKLVSRETVQAKQGRARQGAEPQDALELLESQHRMVESLFNDLAQAPNGSRDFRRRFLELADLLAIHSTIEERIFYPAVKAQRTQQLVKRSVEEHLQVKRVLAALMEATPSDEDLLPELEELGGLTEEHVIEEEHELFPRVRKLLNRDQLVELAQQMSALMAELQREGEPRRHVLEETEAPAQV